MAPTRMLTLTLRVAIEFPGVAVRVLRVAVRAGAPQIYISLQRQWWYKQNCFKYLATVTVAVQTRPPHTSRHSDSGGTSEITKVNEVGNDAHQATVTATVVMMLVKLP